MQNKEVSKVILSPKDVHVLSQEVGKICELTLKLVSRPKKKKTPMQKVSVESPSAKPEEMSVEVSPAKKKNVSKEKPKKTYSEDKKEADIELAEAILEGLLENYSGKVKEDRFYSEAKSLGISRYNATTARRRLGYYVSKEDCGSGFIHYIVRNL